MLVLNGCSYTYGDELDDPSTQCWGYHLANDLNLPLMNLAEGGSCNSKIYRDTIDFLMSHNTEDITQLIIMWSAFERFEVYDRTVDLPSDPELSLIQMSPSRTNSKNKMISKNKESWEGFYADLYNTHTGIVHTLTYMSSIAWICHRLNIKVLQTWFHPFCVRVLSELYAKEPKTKAEAKLIRYVRNKLDFLPNNNKVGFLDDIMTFDDFTITNKYKLCPEGHPGAEAHKAFSKYLGGYL